MPAAEDLDLDALPKDEFSGWQTSSDLLRNSASELPSDEFRPKTEEDVNMIRDDDGVQMTLGASVAVLAAAMVLAGTANLKARKARAHSGSNGPCQALSF
eukprot:3934842-Rhodomonas_salina.1